MIKAVPTCNQSLAIFPICNIIHKTVYHIVVLLNNKHALYSIYLIGNSEALQKSEMSSSILG